MFFRKFCTHCNIFISVHIMSLRLSVKWMCYLISNPQLVYNLVSVVIWRLHSYQSPEGHVKNRDYRAWSLQIWWVCYETCKIGVFTNKSGISIGQPSLTTIALNDLFFSKAHDKWNHNEVWMLNWFLGNACILEIFLAKHFLETLGSATLSVPLEVS